MKKTILAIFCFVLLATNVAQARNMSSYPMNETFNTSGQYSDIVCNDSGTTTYLHESTGGWNGGGAAKFTFVNGIEDNSGICNIVFPHNGTSEPRRINIRYLVYYGSGYINTIGASGSKNIILLRCNNTCTDVIEPTDGRRSSAFRGMVSGSDFLNICENVDCPSWIDHKDPSKPDFRISQHFNQWISYEAEFDLTNNIGKLFIDTQDGVQNSQNGTSPYQVWTEWEYRNNGWLSLDWLLGYWGDRVNSTANSYYKVDELVIDDNYIGPPAGFNSANPTPPPPPPSSLPRTISLASLQGPSNKTVSGTLKVYNSSRTEIQSIPFTTNSSGSASVTFTVPAQTVTLKTIIPKYLNKTLTNVNLSSTSTYTFATVRVGDLNADNLVNSVDFSLLNASWFQNNASRDLNSDGLINTVDFSLMNPNWFVSGDVE